MPRKLLAVVVGYVVVAGTVMVAFTVTAKLLGMDGIYKPGVYEPTTTWLLLSFVIGIVAAVAGGFVCRLIGRSRMLVHAFAAVVLVLGLLSVAFAAFVEKPDPGPRPEGETLTEAVRKTTQPMWVGLLNPLIGAGGVLLGGGLRRDPPQD